MKISLFAKRVIAPLAPVVALASIVGFTHAHNTRIATKLAVVVAIVASLAGCQSYYALQDECANGNVEACKTVQSRDRLMGTAAAGLNGYNAQRLTEAQINALNAASAPQPQSMRCVENIDHSVTCNSQ